MTYELSNLAVNPHKGVMVGQSVEITVQVRNLLSNSQNLSIKLYINNHLIQSKPVAVSGSESVTVAFTVIENLEGDYNVEIGGLTGYFHVYPATSPTTSSGTTGSGTATTPNSTTLPTTNNKLKISIRRISADRNTVFIWDETAKSLYKSTDGGFTFSPPLAITPVSTVLDMQISPQFANDKMVMLMDETEVWASTDGGTSFVNLAPDDLLKHINSSGGVIKSIDFTPIESTTPLSILISVDGQQSPYANLYSFNWNNHSWNLVGSTEKEPGQATAVAILGKTAKAFTEIQTTATATATIVDGVITEIRVTHPGSGYPDTGPGPVVTITGDGTGATAVSTYDPATEVVTGIKVTNGGSGYKTATVTIAPPQKLSGVSYVWVTDGGSGYLFPPTVTFTGGGGSGVGAVAVITNGVVTAANLTFYGSGYTSPPTVTFDAPGTVTTITLTDGGSGYAIPPKVIIFGGGGTGATAIATIVDGVVTSITLTNPGSGYTSTPSIIVEPPGHTNVSTN